MRIALSICVVAVGVSGVAQAQAQAQGLANLATIVSLKGTCSRLLVGGKDESKGCTGLLVQPVFKDGRLAFNLTGDEAVVGFGGDLGKRVKLDPNKVSQPIDRISVTLLNAKAQGPDDLKTTRLPAVGQCTYTNPEIGVSNVVCTADTAQGRFEATFASDGKPPEFHDF